MNNGFKRKNVTEDYYVLINNSIFKIYNMESITEYIKKQQVKYLAHILPEVPTAHCQKIQRDMYHNTPFFMLKYRNVEDRL